MYASLKDVAAVAGVSFQTASKVLNGRGGTVSARTRQRIEDAAAQLGYVPNALARGLVRKASLTVGILADDFSDVSLAQFVVAAQRRLSDAGHTALVSSTRPDRDNATAVRRLREHRVDGLLLVAPSLEDDERLGAALGAPTPAVALHHVTGASIPLVGSDHSRTGRLAAEHLVALGHLRIATITGPASRRVVRSRHRGFEAGLGAAVVARLVATDWSADGAYAATRELFADQPGTTAVFVHNDTMALGVLAALRDLDVDVPGRCSVVSCDDLPVATYTAPPLTTVRVPFQRTGETAADLLLRRIAGDDVPARTVLPVDLVVRSSTASRTGVHHE